MNPMNPMNRSQDTEHRTAHGKTLGLAAWTENDVIWMEGLLGPGGVVTEPSDIERYATDWTGSYRGRPPFVLRPMSTRHVSEILRYAHARALPIVPQSGNTGLVGGSVPLDHELVLSLERMQRVLGLDLEVPALVCEAGAILQDLETVARGEGLGMPVDLGSRGSCRAGGLVATHAGGMRLVRDGSLGASILGLEVVLADGRILSSLKTLRKDNTGYRWRDLFVGSEGTLGVITGVSFLLHPLARARRTALIPLETLDEIAPAIRVLRQSLGRSLAALELIDRETTSLVAREIPEARAVPCPGACNLLLEIEGPAGGRLEEDLVQGLQDLASAGLDHAAEEAILAQGDMETRALWHLRESITEAIRRTGSSRKFDVSVPPKAYSHVVSTLRTELRERWPHLSLLTFGHAADGNLHLNIVGPRPHDGWETVDDAVYDRVLAAGGSISAEHGIGVLKKRHLGRMRTPEELALMREMKRLLDPQGILNPGKLLGPDSPHRH